VSIKVALCQPYRFVVRVVVVAGFGFLDFDVLEIIDVQQLASEIRAST